MEVARSSALPFERGLYNLTNHKLSRLGDTLGLWRVRGLRRLRALPLS